METPPQLPGPPDSLARFVDGLLTPFRGMAYLARHPSLLHLAVLPMLINLVVFVALLVLLYPWLDARLESYVPTTGWLHVALAVPARILAAILAAVIGAVFVNLTACLVAAPFNDALSARVEAIEGRLPETPSVGILALLGHFWSMAADELMKWGLYFGALAFLLPLWLLPVIGHLLWTVLGGAITFWFLGFEYMDFCFSRRRMRFTARRQFLWRNKRAVIGLGMAVTATTMVPFAGLVVMPFSVVGATLLYLGLTPAEKAPPPAA